MDRLLADLAHAYRRLSRAPAFAFIAILTLALGIGANTAIFSIVKAVLLSPLPYGEPEQLAMIWGARDKGEMTWIAGPEVLDYSGDTTALEGVAAYYGTAANLTGGEEPERVITAQVTPNLFAVLRVAPVLGRVFDARQNTADIANDVVIGYGLWQRRFGGRTDILGQQVQLNGRSRTVIGVMPPTFKLPLDFGGERPSELWSPLDLRSADWSSWGDHSLLAFTRLRRDITASRGNAALKAAEDRWIREGHWSNRESPGRSVVAMQELIVGDVRYALWILLGAVGVILLIACANVANLMLARSDDRHREIAVRAALGASRSTIVQQLLTESVLLSGIGGACGVALAFLATRGLVAAQPPGIPRLGDVRLDAGVLAFSLFLTVATGVVFGLAPALELSRPDVNRALKEGGRTGTVGRARQRFRDALAIAQMAFSVVLLISAMLLVRSFVQLRHIDLGFKPDRALTFRTTLPQATYPKDADVVSFYRTLRQRLAELPGIEAVGAARLLPLTGTIGDWSITLEGRIRVPGENPNGDWQVAMPGYFESMRTPIVRGRVFTDADNENAPLVAVINQAMARRYWPTEDAIGKRFHLGTAEQPWITVVGLVAQVRHNAVTEGARAEMYIPHAQFGVAGASAPRGMTFVLRTTGDPLAALGYARQTVRSLDPKLPIADIQTLDRVADDSLAQPRFTTALLAAFAALALALATIGIYGVISLLVTRRRQEIGIRMALGARPSSILRMIVRRGMGLAGIGVSIGVFGAALLTRLLTSMLYGVTRFDAVTFATVPVVLAGVALIACLIPAGRAATVDPVVALRQD